MYMGGLIAGFEVREKVSGIRIFFFFFGRGEFMCEKRRCESTGYGVRHWSFLRGKSRLD